MTVRIKPSVPSVPKGAQPCSFKEAAGGPVGSLHGELEERLAQPDDRVWMLPPEPLSEHEMRIRRLSQAAGAVALALGVTALLFVIFR
jgi:hypothetical protein